MVVRFGSKTTESKYHENRARSQLRKPLPSLGLGLISHEIFSIEYSDDGYKQSSFDADSKKSQLTLVTKCT
jgi:hypothetical protein